MNDFVKYATRAMLALLIVAGAPAAYADSDTPAKQVSNDRDVDLGDPR